MSPSVQYRFLALPVLLAGLLPVAHAGFEVNDITWISTLFANNRDSNGDPLDTSFTFHLGVFNPPAPGGASWEPTPTNTSEWATHWITADVAVYNTFTSSFSAGYTAEPLVEGVSLTGKQGYIWGTNREDPDGDWILITNPAWIWPAPGSGGLGFPETWTVQGATAVIGQVDGGGVHLQTQQVANAAPPLLKPDLWRHAHFTQEEIDNQEAGLSGWLADPNNNGRPNVLEYAFGTHPRLPHLVKQPVHGIVKLGGASHATLTAHIGSNVEVILTAEVSTDLLNWFDGPGQVTLHSQTTTELVFRDLTELSAAQPFRAMRLKATLP